MNIIYMKKNLLAVAGCIVLGMTSCQQPNQEQKEQVTVMVSLSEDSQTDDLQLFVYPLGIDYDDDSPMQALPDGSYSQTMPTAPLGMYSMVCVKGTSQYSLPLSFMAVQDTVCLSVNLEGECPSAQILSGFGDRRAKAIADAGMDALNSFNALYYSLSRKVWTDAQSMDVQGLKDMISEYGSLEKEIAGNRKVSADVKEYVKVWSYLQSFESCTVFKRMNGSKVNIFGTDDAMLCRPDAILDSEYALLHQSALNTASQAIPKGTLDERLKYICDNYSTAAVREGLQRNVLNSFIRNFNFSNGYEQGLEVLNAAQSTYGIDQSFIDAFMERVSSTPGAPFPDIELVNADGERVSIDMFRGKYVYVDLWASWCIPCCKEVPYLQALEREMSGSDVVFVSISIDESEQAWRGKMSELGMHGNQWWNSDGKLCDKLNVSGIPHFLIYGPDGKLHTYSAPRPSAGDALKKLFVK